MSHAMRLPNTKPSVIANRGFAAVSLSERVTNYYREARWRAGHWSKHHQKTKRKIARADAWLPKFVKSMVGIKGGVKRPHQLK